MELTAKQKADELFGMYYVITQTIDKYSYLLRQEEKDLSKQCAILLVEEILNELPEGSIDYSIMHRIEYWKEVKKEIEAL